MLISNEMQRRLSQLIHTMKKTSRLLVCLACVFLAAAVRAEDAKAKITIPDTVPAIWAEINKQDADLTAAIQSQETRRRSPSRLQHPRPRGGLARQSPRRQEERASKAVRKTSPTLADKLDAAGDNGKQADAEAGLKQLDAVLKQIKSPIPGRLIP